jgi:hypothetical protein
MEDSDEYEGHGRARITSNSSSPPITGSTSPTSPEADEGQKAEKEEENRRATHNLLENLSDESSDEDKPEEKGGAIDFFAKHGTLKDQLKAVDEEMDEREQAPVTHRTKTRPLSPPTSSSLPTLTDSEAHSRPQSSSQPTPSARPSSAGVRIRQADDDDESQEVIAPTARPKPKRGRILDSEDENEEEDEEANKTVLARPLRRSNVVQSSDDEGNVGSSSPVRSAPSAPAPSKQERILALAAKKKAALPPVVSPPRKVRDDATSEIESTSSDEESKTANRKKPAKKSSGKPKVKVSVSSLLPIPLSLLVDNLVDGNCRGFRRRRPKRCTNNLHLSLEVSFPLVSTGSDVSFQTDLTLYPFRSIAEQEARLAPSIKNSLNVADILKRGSSKRQYVLLSFSLLETRTSR